MVPPPSPPHSHLCFACMRPWRGIPMESWRWRPFFSLYHFWQPARNTGSTALHSCTDAQAMHKGLLDCTKSCTHCTVVAYSTLDCAIKGFQLYISTMDTFGALAQWHVGITVQSCTVKVLLCCARIDYVVSSTYHSTLRPTSRCFVPFDHAIVAKYKTTSDN